MAQSQKQNVCFPSGSKESLIIHAQGLVIEPMKQKLGARHGSLVRVNILGIRGIGETAAQNYNQSKMVSNQITNYDKYRKFMASYNMSCLKAHAGFFRLVMKGIFDLYVV